MKYFWIVKENKMTTNLKGPWQEGFSVYCNMFYCHYGDSIKKKKKANNKPSSFENTKKLPSILKPLKL